jgi:hypothetical protein
VTLIGPGPADKADFYDGVFKLSQAKGLTTLTLTEPLACKGRRGRAAAAATRPKTRRLWGDGKGKFRTQGQYASATIRGTKWLVEDGCNYARITVKKGVVSVRDKVRKKTLIKRKGAIYTIRKRR